MTDEPLLNDAQDELRWEPRVDNAALSAAWAALGVSSVDHRIHVEY
jgi:hypothetical protein